MSDLAHGPLLKMILTLIFLFQSFDRDFAIEDHLGRHFKAVDVFARSIESLKKECSNCLKENNLKVSDDEIDWVLSVPSIWDESAKQFMRTAAAQVLISI